jgi:hypothetical protein
MRSSKLSPLLAICFFASAAPLRAAPVSGTVTAADGSPAAGAIVWAASLERGPLQTRETTADKNGAYTLELEPGSWYIWARRGTQGGRGGGQHEIVIGAGQVAKRIAIRLEERGTFRGRVLEAETGKPVPGARLFLDAGLVLTANGKGQFEMGGLERTNHEMYVVAPGRMRTRILFDNTAGADTELEVPVPRGGKIVGRVTDPNGKPIAGAYVGKGTSGTIFSIRSLWVKCDADGRYEYDGAPQSQPTWLSAAAPGYVGEDLDSVVVPEEDKPLHINFRLRPKPPDKPSGKADDKRRIVKGVVRGPDMKPVADVVVRWGYMPYSNAIEARTDAQGRFQMTVPHEAGLLAVLPRELEPQVPEIMRGGDQEVEISLRRGHTVRGQVRDEDGKPIRNVQVIAVMPSPDPRVANPMWLRESSVLTDADGKFELRGMPESARFDFLKGELTDLRNHELNMAGGVNEVTMKYGGALVGRVIDRAGKPIRNFRILVSFPRERREGERTEGFFAGYSGIGVRFTSADGSFVLTGVGADSIYRVRALADGHDEAILDRVQAVALNRLAKATPATLRCGPPVSLRVRAVTSKGEAVAGARVTLVDGNPSLDTSFYWGGGRWENTVRGRTAKDGWADFPSLSFGTATVLVEAPGHARRRLGWRKGEKELTVELPREAVLTGTIHDAAGGLLEKGYVALKSDGDHIGATIRPDSKGRFRFTELPAGTWTISVRATDGLTELHEGQVTLKAGETKELKIETQAP